jgi:outer membrane protein assembly factor BamE (lipoprotein component of BamABCDE complex)
MKFPFTALIVCLLFSACNQSIDLKNFDEMAWQNDKGACQNVRSTMRDDLENDKDQLKGLNQDEIISVLGRPDENELYKRSQKFFIYHITPKNCDGQEFEQYTYLSIRFNATGMAKEVIVYETKI